MNKFLVYEIIFFGLFIAVRISALTGGEVINSQKQYAYHVVVLDNHTRYLVANGAIVSKRFILSIYSPIRKFIPKNLDRLTIESATSNNNNSLKYSIKKVLFHKEYRRSPEIHDLAIVEVLTPISFSSNFRPISILQEDIPSHAVVTISGWDPSFGSTKMSFKHIKVLVENMETCKWYYPRIDDYQFCTSTEESKGVCAEDAGAPVIYSGKLVGLVKPRSSCRPDVPVLLIKIVKYIPWILNNCLFN